MTAEQGSYYTFHQGLFELLSLREIGKLKDEKTNGPIWSARLSSGLLGLTNCPAGKRGPKNLNEVILAQGHEGLAYLIWLGFTPCPACRPEKEEQFWPSAHGPIELKYHLDDEHDFLRLDFDARRLLWEEIPVTPNRLYVPPYLTLQDLLELKERFDHLGRALPPIGYYDHEAPGHFTEYQIPS